MSNEVPPKMLKTSLQNDSGSSTELGFMTASASSTEDNETFTQDANSTMDDARARFMQALEIEVEQLKQQEAAEIEKLQRAKTSFQGKLGELAKLEECNALENLKSSRIRSDETDNEIKSKQVEAESQLEALKRSGNLQIKSLQSDSSRLIESKLNAKELKLEQLES